MNIPLLVLPLPSHFFPSLLRSPLKDIICTQILVRASVCKNKTKGIVKETLYTPSSNYSHQPHTPRAAILVPTSGVKWFWPWPTLPNSYQHSAFKILPEPVPLFNPTFNKHYLSGMWLHFILTLLSFPWKDKAACSAPESTLIFHPSASSHELFPNVSRCQQY